MEELSRNSDYEYVRVTFNKTLKACEGKAYDCKLFVNMYLLLVEAIEEFYRKGYENPLIRSGFSMILKQKLEELKNLEISLKNRGMI